MSLPVTDHRIVASQPTGLTSNSPIRAPAPTVYPWRLTEVDEAINVSSMIVDVRKDGQEKVKGC